MKKTLLAIAALAATSGAFAQSSVTIYGILDASVDNVNGLHGATRVSSDNYATSRLGFKGTEDIGGGLKAKFVLETNAKPDVGSSGNTSGTTTRFFDRAAWVGLQGNFGELRLGRIDSSIGYVAGDITILGAQPYDDFKIAKTRAGDSYRRVDNAVTYVLPKLVDGLTAQLQYSTAVNSGITNAETNPTTDAGKAYGLNVQYAAGPFSAGLGFLSAKDETGLTPVTTANAGRKANASLVYAAYDFGVVKLTGYYDSESKVFGADRLSLVGVRFGVPITENFSVQASLTQASNVGSGFTGAATYHGDHDDATIAAFKAVYTLSKRTSVYGLVTNVHNESLAALAVDYSTRNAGTLPARGGNDHGIAFGIRHNF